MVRLLYRSLQKKLRSGTTFCKKDGCTLRMGIRLQILWFRHISHQGSRDGDMLQQYANNNEEKSKKGTDLIQQCANNEEKSRKGTYLIQQHANNEEKSRKGTDLIQPFASEKKHSGQSLRQRPGYANLQNICRRSVTFKANTLISKNN